MSEIILIYDSTDAKVVDRLADEIAKAGVSVSKLSSTSTNMAWQDFLPREFAMAKAVVVVLSPSSSASEFVDHCVMLALQEGKLVPLRTHDFDPGKLRTDRALLFSHTKSVQVYIPFVDDWDAIGEAISARFEAPAGNRRAEAQAAPTSASDAAGSARPGSAHEIRPAVVVPPPVAAAPAPVPPAAPAAQPPPPPANATAALNAAMAAEATPTQAAPMPVSSSSATPPPAPPVAASPPPPRQREGVGAAASAPAWRPEGVGAASDGPSNLGKLWRRESDTGGELARFGIPTPQMSKPMRPPSLTVDALQTARGTAAPLLPNVAHGGEADVDDVDCSVFAPPSARQGTRAMVQVFLHRIEQAERAQFLAQTMDDTAKLRGVETLHIPIPRRTWVDVELDGRGLLVTEGVRKLLWNGQPTVASFEVEVPVGFTGEVCHPVARLLVDGEPVGRILFQVRIEAPTREVNPLPAPELGGTRARSYQYAFLSYASKDRAEVLKRAQAFQAAKLEFFQDVLSLEPGQRYGEEILRRIDGSDLFVVFWSRNAMRSEWVQKEIDKALACQRDHPDGLPDIVPIMLEPIAKAPPPPALAHLHMNAPINTLIAAEQPSMLQRVKQWLFG